MPFYSFFLYTYSVKGTPVPTPPVITLEEVQIQGKEKGYTLSVDEDQIIVVNTAHPQVFKIFERTPDFVLDRKRAGEYALMQVSYWIWGYDLNAGDDGTFVLHRLPHHPASTPTKRVALELDYSWNCHDQLPRLHAVLERWICTIEQLEGIATPHTMAHGELPEDIQDDRIGSHVWQPMTEQEGVVQAIQKWPNGEVFLWVQGNGYRFCDLEENLEVKRSRRRSQS
jgi:hypothetical protein